MRLIGAIVCLLAVVCHWEASAEPALTVEKRFIRQVAIDPYLRGSDPVRQAWVLNYELRYVGGQKLILNASDVELSMKGWLSNSIVPGNGAPKPNETTITGSAPSTRTYLIPTRENQCFERTTFWYSDDKKPVLTAGKDENVSDPLPVREIYPNEVVKLTVQIEHFHSQLGAFEPLFGERNLQFKIGPFQINDQFRGEDHYRKYNPNHPFKPVAKDRFDNRHFVSAPDSYYLAAHISEMGSLSLAEKTIRPHSRQRLSFYYLVARDGETPLSVEIKQFQSTPEWMPLSEENEIVTLETVGQWKKVEKVIRVARNAESIALRFYIGGEIGEAWIDDVKLEPVDAAQEGP